VRPDGKSTCSTLPDRLRGEYTAFDTLTVVFSRPPPKLVREGRRNVVDSLLEVLTAPHSQITSTEIEHSALVAECFNVREGIDRLLGPFYNKPEVVTEVQITLLVQGLCR
jgi:hypothetical protein